MTAPCVGTCNETTGWLTADDLCAPCVEFIDYTGSPLEDSMKMASDLLFFASAQQFPGTCRELVRPCGQGFQGVYVPYNLRHLSGWPCGHEPGSCSCTPFRKIDLAFQPLTSIVGIKVCNDSNPDWPGTCVLDPAYYHIDNFALLVRDENPDGTNPGWPNCGQMSPSTALEDTFEVDFTYGLEPPSFLKRAAAVLACEIYMACSPEAFEDTVCRLPRNVQSIVRQGVSIVMQSAFFTPINGKPVQFGIPEVDMALAMVNPHGLTAPSAIVSPDDFDLVRRVDT